MLLLSATDVEDSNKFRPLHEPLLNVVQLEADDLGSGADNIAALAEAKLHALNGLRSMLRQSDGAQLEVHARTTLPVLLKLFFVETEYAITYQPQTCLYCALCGVIVLTCACLGPCNCLAADAVILKTPTRDRPPKPPLPHPTYRLQEIPLRPQLR